MPSAPPIATRSTRRFASLAGVSGIMAITLALHLWGIHRDLPYVTEDPRWIVNPAIRIAASGDLNPREFAYPGSTLIYPLAAVYRAWYAVGHAGSWWHPDPGLRRSFAAHAAEFYLLGRLLTVVYALFSVPLVYALGRQTVGERAALIGALLAALYPTELFAKQVRTDSASLFFALLGLWACLRLYRRPTTGNQIVAGGAIGLAIGTKYYLGALVAVLGTVDALVVRRRMREGAKTSGAWLGGSVGVAAIAVAFLCCTPYFLLEFSAVLASFRLHFGSTHIGADGLSPSGNLLWYVTSALPSSISWEQTVFAIIGMTVALWRRSVEPMLLLVFVAAFVVGISASSLHWARWLIPILPVFALLAAEGLTITASAIGARLGLAWGLQQATIVLAVLALCVAPLRQIAQTNRVYTNPSTNVLARQWIEQNLPPGSHLAFEYQTLPPPLQSDSLGVGIWTNRDGGRNLVEMSMSQLAVRGTVDYYVRSGFRYLVTSSLFYAYYPSNADRYPAEAAFYRTLIDNSRLLYEVKPSATHEGDEIRVYEIGG
jgi:hypothetical protein